MLIHQRKNQLNKVKLPIMQIKLPGLIGWLSPEILNPAFVI